MYSLPQEIEVWYIIPAVRKYLSKVLVKKYGLTYEKAGATIGISKAAVSQYLSNKRGTAFKIPEAIKKEIDKSAERIAKDDKRAVMELERILILIRKKKSACEVCKKYNKDIINFCKCKPVC